MSSSLTNRFIWASFLCLLRLGKEPHTFIRFSKAKIKTEENSFNFWSELTDDQNVSLGVRLLRAKPLPRCPWAS